MGKDVKCFRGLFCGCLFSIVLWISFLGWMKILIPHFHYCKEWLISLLQL
ncbi:hypothetical protein IIM_01308 [Bacillus cereus VD107]|nr:hypothetical protein IIM_01308 [Bacillus cereus VD107]